MARRKTRRRKTAKRKTSKRKPRRTAAQRRATAALVALNKKRAKGGRKVTKRKASAKGKGSHHTTPALPSIYRRNVHTAVTVRPRSRYAGSHHPEAQTVRIKPRRDVGHEFYD